MQSLFYNSFFVSSDCHFCVTLKSHFLFLKIYIIFVLLNVCSFFFCFICIVLEILIHPFLFLHIVTLFGLICSVVPVLIILFVFLITKSLYVFCYIPFFVSTDSLFIWCAMHFSFKSFPMNGSFSRSQLFFISNFTDNLQFLLFISFHKPSPITLQRRRRGG